MKFRILNHCGKRAWSWLIETNGFVTKSKKMKPTQGGAIKSLKRYCLIYLKFELDESDIRIIKTNERFA